MVTEIVILIVAIIAAFLLWKVLKTVKNMVINTIAGLIVLVIANLALGLDIAYSWVTILISNCRSSRRTTCNSASNYLGIAF
ncbi:MAG: pro-sigmaK processing inhibitor BofA family protein [Methanolobus sp.]